MNSATDILYHTLRHCPDELADVALVDALPNVEPEQRRQMCRIILDRSTLSGLSLLLQVLHHLDNETIEEVAGGIELLSPSLRTAVRSKDYHTRLNTITLLSYCEDMSLGYLLSLGMRDSAATVRQRAATAVYRLTRLALAARTGQPHPDESELSGGAGVDEHHWRSRWSDDNYRSLLDVVHTGLESYGVHRRGEILLSAMLVADDLTTRTWSLLTAPRSQVGQACVEMFSRHASPEYIGFAMRALGAAHLRKPVLETIGRITDKAFIEAWLDRSHLVHDAGVRSGWSRLKQWSAIQDDTRLVLGLSDQQQVQLVRLLQRSGLEDSSKATLYTCIAMYGGARSKQAALWALSRICDQSHTVALGQLASRSESPEICRLAGRELLRRRAVHWPTAKWRLLTSRASRSGGGVAGTAQPDNTVTQSQQGVRLPQSPARPPVAGTVRRPVPIAGKTPAGTSDTHPTDTTAKQPADTRVDQGNADRVQTPRQRTRGTRNLVAGNLSGKGAAADKQTTKPAAQAPSGSADAPTPDDSYAPEETLNKLESIMDAWKQLLASNDPEIQKTTRSFIDSLHTQITTMSKEVTGRARKSS